MGAYDEAEARFGEAAASATICGDTNMQARVIDALSVTLHVRGQAREARHCAERALALFRNDGDVRGIAVATDHIGKCSTSLGEAGKAWSCHRESLNWRRKFGDPRGMAVWLEAMAGLLSASMCFATVARILGAMESFREAHGIPRHQHELVQLAPIEGAARQGLSTAAFAKSWSLGTSMTLAEIIELACDDAERAVGDSTASSPIIVSEPAPASLARQGLTARERDIVELLARRLSDRAIAERLAISHRTVSSHVSRIFAKLGVRDRETVARMADAWSNEEHARHDEQRRR